MNFDNPAFDTAFSFIQNSNRALFLTGKAGTGKTTFLKHIMKNSNKNMVVLAPTGVAAINAGGSTIHSFFQLPFTPFLPVKKYDSSFDRSPNTEADSIDSHTLINRIKISEEKRKIIRQLELLIIDEISMVRSDLLDAIDTVLRYVRANKHEPFGGVQLLFIGDLFQLPPVMPDDQWAILSEHYKSPYFFDSIVLKDNPPMQIELTKIYRQSEQKFIDLLNEIRNNELSEEGEEILYKKFDPDFKIPTDQQYIQLTTHNAKADATNEYELNQLHEVQHTFNATITGEFYEKAFPAEEILRLKIGAQVMFLKNDTEKTRRYFNGKIGVIEKIVGEEIYVKCENQDTIKVKKEVWSNIKYVLKKETQQIQEDEIGTFTQYPLRLAWAITIHKSQGLTFEKAVIDAGGAFTFGQVYVALSRCTSLSGMVLKSMITPSGLRTNEKVVDFLSSKLSENLHKSELRNSKFEYELKILAELLDFRPMVQLCAKLMQLTETNASSFNPQIVIWLQDLYQDKENWQTIGEKFLSQLNSMAADIDSVQENEGMQTRISAGCKYFVPLLSLSIQNLSTSAFSTDNIQLAKSYNGLLSELNIGLAYKSVLFESLLAGFSTQNYHQAKKIFVAPRFTVNSYGGNNQNKNTKSANPDLYQMLRLHRDALVQSEGVPIYMICSTISLEQMCEFLPLTPQELVKISGFGEMKVKKYGAAFLEIIVDYCQMKNISGNMAKLEPKRERKVPADPNKISTKQISYDLYKEGKNMTEIAEIRNFSISTIEGHLAAYVASGEIKIEDLLPKQKLTIIENIYKNIPNDVNKTSYIKEKVGDDIGYGEIKLALAWLDSVVV